MRYVEIHTHVGFHAGVYMDIHHSTTQCVRSTVVYTRGGLKVWGIEGSAPFQDLLRGVHRGPHPYMN